jgi:AcrR family transcriptional regulator
MIVDAAIRFFAEVGFGGQTRELARKIGISQPLLYKYFPRKEDLVDRVYREVYLGRWNPYWETVLGNDRVPLRDRLTQFYVDYASKIMDYEWIRIFMYAGLLGSGINAKYIDLLRDRVILRICHALRAERGLPRVDDRRISAREEQLVWSLQGSMLYMAIQKYLYGFELDVDLTSAVEDRVDAFLDGVPAVFEALAGPKKRKKSA